MATVTRPAHSGTGLPLTSWGLREHLANPGLDAQAENERQRLLLHDRSPEVDSLVEFVAQLPDHGVPIRLTQEFIGNLRALVASNARERGHEQAFTAVAEDLARLVGGHERNVGPTGALSTKSLARKLRPALRVIADPSAASAAETVDAGHALRLLFQGVPASRLRSTGLAHELGKRPTALLLELLAPTNGAHPARHGLGSPTHGCAREPAVRE